MKLLVNTCHRICWQDKRVVSFAAINLLHKPLTPSRLAFRPFLFHKASNPNAITPSLLRHQTGNCDFPSTFGHLVRRLLDTIGRGAIGVLVLFIVLSTTAYVNTYGGGASPVYAFVKSMDKCESSMQYLAHMRQATSAGTSRGMWALT